MISNGARAPQALGEKMRRNQRSLLWLGISILAVLTLSSALLGQASRNSEAAAPAISDWSNHHVVFSRPATTEQAERVEQDPRYWQQIRRQSPALPAVETDRLETDRLETDRVVASSLAHRLRPSRTGKNQGLNGFWSEDMGTGATVGAGNYPAKYSVFVNKASCATDFVVYSTGLPGGGAQASLVAYSNLYSGCTGTVPSVYWAYDTFATVGTSPIFSFDGTRIAVVQQNSAGHAVLMLLKWKSEPAETIIAPGRPRQVRAASFQSCTAPCKTLFFLNDLISSVSTPAGDTDSSVFLDYRNDAAYVGDSLGFLHKFSPVFEGTPAEVTTGGWPVQVSSTALTSPVHDAGSENVFVEDKGGFLYSVDPSGVVTQSAQLDFSTANDSGPGFVQGPIVDSVSGQVYAFVTSDGNGDCSPTGADCTGVFELPTNFTASTVPSEAVVGNSTVAPAAPNPMYIGAFDSTYENSINATGHLYVCGNTGGAPTVFQISIGDGALGTVTPGPVLATGTTPCSPLTDVFNPNVTGGATEWVFGSPETNGNSTGCTGGCIFNFKDTPWAASNPYTAGQEVLDSNLHIEVVEVGGLSGATPPFWNSATGKTTPDHGVTWLDQGPATVIIPAAWAPSTGYAVHSKILDGNNNVEYATTGGTSGASVTFNAAPGGTTSDGSVKWQNLGAIATANMPSAGGTSGIIIDNFVSALTEAGASQVYFSTLSNQTCGTSGTGGCAVQASQSALK
jgi:hypothetical protein